MAKFVKYVRYKQTTKLWLVYPATIGNPGAERRRIATLLFESAIEHGWWINQNHHRSPLMEYFASCKLKIGGI